MQIFYLVLSIWLEGLKYIVFGEGCGQNKVDNSGAAVLILFSWFAVFFLADSSYLNVLNFVLFYFVNWIFIS